MRIYEKKCAWKKIWKFGAGGDKVVKIKKGWYYDMTSH